MEKSLTNSHEALCHTSPEEPKQMKNSHKKNVIEVSDDSSTIKARDELIILPDDDDVLELLKEFTPELNSIFFNQSTSFTT